MNPKADRTTSRAFDATSKQALSIRTLSSSTSTLSATACDMKMTNVPLIL